MSITIRDVAKAAGVSPSTVSKVLNHSPLISPQTTDHVNSVMKELHYIPNMRARNFAKQKTKTIVFLTLSEPHMALMNPYVFEILTGTEEIFHKEDYMLQFVNALSLDDAYQVIQKIIATKNADGIILHGYAVSPEITNLLLTQQFPHILIGKPCFETTSSWIDINNIVAGEIAASFLYDCGIRRMAFIGGRKQDRISQMRLHGVRQFATQRFIPISKQYVLFGEPTIAEGYKLTSQLLSSLPIPDGIICENSITAVGVVKAIHEYGFCIPKDISFICFDNYPFSFMIDPLPTVVDINVYSLGVEAAKNLLKIIKCPQLHVQSYITLPSVIQRNSTK